MTGQRYDNMAWEDIVVDVCVQGLPEKLWEASRQWQAQFELIGNIPRDLRAHKENVAKVWDSAAGRAFQDHLEHLAKQFDDAQDSFMPAVRLLNDSAEHLYTAITQMPIPNNFLDEIGNAHKDWLNSDIDCHVGAVRDGSGKLRTLQGQDSAGRPIQPGDFKAAAQRDWFGDVWHEAPGWFHDKWEEFMGTEEKTAQQRMGDLDNGYNTVTARTDDPKPADPGRYGGQTAIDPKAYGGGAAPRGFGGVGTGSAPHGGFGAGGIDPSSSAGSLPGYGGPSGTGLAGAGGGGLSGLGTGAGGLGGAGSAPLGAPSLSGAGSGAGLTPMSKIGSPTGMMMPPMAPGGRGAAGRGAGATGRRGAGAGMMGGGHGAGTGTDDDRSTWLTEDEDPWGGSSDAAPPVLGR
jgi:hypothetical protein